ncbi:MAG TPA: hypothetical protein VJR06_03955 [Nitrososphaerales archaeon]|nr:hypothetical protein [Nitrososphaerales archaeon]
MVLEIATVLLGASVGAVVVIYAAARGYLGHKKKAAAPVASIHTYATTTEQAEVPATEAPAVAEPAPSPATEPTPAPEAAPSPAPALYESVQPAPAPVTFSAPSSASFGAPTLAKKPTRTYRRRTAPVRSAAGVKKTLAKPKKR